MKKISQSFFVDFDHLYSDRVFYFEILFLNMIEDLPCSSWYNTHKLIIEYIITIHSESFSTSSLTICKYGAVVPHHNIINHLFPDKIKHFFLCRILSKHMIVCKDQVTIMTVIFFLYFDSLVIIAKHDHFIFRWV